MNMKKFLHVGSGPDIKNNKPKVTETSESESESDVDENEQCNFCRKLSTYSCAYPSCLANLVDMAIHQLIYSSNSSKANVETQNQSVLIDELEDSQDQDEDPYDLD